MVIHTINGWRTEYKTVNEFQRSEWDWRLHVWFMHDEPFVLKTINFPMYPLMTSLIVGVYEHLMIPVPTEMFNQFSLNAVVRPGVQVIFAFDLSPDSVKAKFRREA